MKLRAAVPGGSVFLAEGTHDQPANVLTAPMVEVRQGRRSGRAGGERRRGDRHAGRRGPRGDAAYRTAQHPARGPQPVRGRLHMIVFAQVGYYEAWWIQILKAVVIFAVVFQLVPGRAAGRARAARPLPVPLRPQPRGSLRRRRREALPDPARRARRGSAAGRRCDRLDAGLARPPLVARLARTRTTSRATPACRSTSTT